MRLPEGVDLAVNGGFFARLDAVPETAAGWTDGQPVDIVGLTRSEGRTVSPLRRPGEPEPALLVDETDEGRSCPCTVRPALATERDLDGVEVAVGGMGPRNGQPGTLLVESGENRGATAQVAPRQRHPRTAAGVTRDGRTLLLFVVDGRQPGWSIGATLPELAALMIEAGAWNAVNLDGGGSRALGRRRVEDLPLRAGPGGRMLRGMAPYDRPTRRSFLTSTGKAATALWAAGPSLLRAQTADKLRLAIIGCGGRGRANLKGVSSEHIAALCDVDRGALDQAAADFPRARKEADFRRLFDRPGEFDAVVVSTTEHTHAFATLPALQLKKHVYCEKPLAYNVEQTRIIREAAARAGVATQMGTQVHASDNYRRVVELVQAGAIGKVSECHVWVARAWGWHASEAEATEHKDIVFVQDRPAVADPVPAGVDWDLWLGPAPARPYSNVYLPGPRWYRWWDFGNGTMSDLGSHWIDLPFWALRLRAPATVEASGPPPHPQIAPASMQARYEYKASGDQPELVLTWYQGTRKPDIWTRGEIPQWPSGVLFVGDRGMLLADYRRHVLLFDEKAKDFTRPPQSIPKSVGHYQEWIDACKTGSPTTCHFAYAGWLTEANHLGNVAYRVGRKIEWDAETMRATNAPEAEPFLARAHRPGWTLA